MTSRITRDWMFLQQFIQVCSKNTRKSSHHWPFVRAIHRWPVDSPHKGWVMRKASPCPDVFMLYLVKYVFEVFRRIWSMLSYITNVHTDVTSSLSSHQDYTLLHCDYQASCAYVVAVDNKKTNYIYIYNIIWSKRLFCAKLYWIVTWEMTFELPSDFVRYRQLCSAWYIRISYIINDDYIITVKTYFICIKCWAKYNQRKRTYLVL